MSYLIRKIPCYNQQINFLNGLNYLICFGICVIKQNHAFDKYLSVLLQRVNEECLTSCLVLLIQCGNAFSGCIYTPDPPSSGDTIPVHPHPRVDKQVCVCVCSHKKSRLIIIWLSLAVFSGYATKCVSDHLY